MGGPFVRGITPQEPLPHVANCLDIKGIKPLPAVIVPWVRNLRLSRASQTDSKTIQSCEWTEEHTVRLLCKLIGQMVHSIEVSISQPSYKRELECL